MNRSLKTIALSKLISSTDDVISLEISATKLWKFFIFVVDFDETQQKLSNCLVKIDQSH